jgi:hypothetical protein
VPTEEGLFSRLIKHRTERHRHLENFLSEILREFLNCLVKTNWRLHRHFVEDLLLKGCSGSPERVIQQISTARHNLVWHSQQTIHLGRRRGLLDLVLSAKSGSPLLIVENKVNAPLGVAAEPEDDDEDDDTNSTAKLDQLHFYGNWLVGKNRNGGLVYLTYATKTLPDYDRENYGVQTCGVARWVSIPEWLSTNRSTIPDLPQYLGDQLQAFLKSEGIMSLEREDVELLNQLFAARIDESNRINAAERTLVEALQAVKKSTAKNFKWLTPRYDWGALVSYAEFQEEETYIGLTVGFTSAPNPAWIPAGQHGLLAFAAVQVRNRETYDRLNPQLTRWGNGEPHDQEQDWWWYASRPVEELRRCPQGFTQAFAEWGRGQVEAAKERVETAMRNAPPRQQRKAKSPKRKPSRKRR